MPEQDGLVKVTMRDIEFSNWLDSKGEWTYKQIMPSDRPSPSTRYYIDLGDGRIKTLAIVFYNNRESSRDIWAVKNELSVKELKKYVL